LSTKN